MKQYMYTSPQVKVIEIVSRLVRVMVAVSAFAVTILSSCDKLEFSDGHSDIRKCSDMLYEVTYSDYSSEAPNGAYEEIAGDLACSSVRNGDFHGRNFDYFANQCPTVVVRTTAKEGRYATIGVARLKGTNEAKMESGLSKEKMDLLPWALFDGMNEKGLVVNANVVSKQDWGKKEDHTGTDKTLPELNVIVAIRPLLDYCANIGEALKYLQAHNITPLPSKKMNLHFMISDSDSTYVVEFIDNKIVAKPRYIMTNYHLLREDVDIPDYAIGVERYDILENNYALGGQSMQGMFDLMKMVRYTNLYKYPEYKWYSELVGPNQVSYTQIINEPEIKPLLDATLADIKTNWAEELKYIEKNGFRAETIWWDTTHNSIYDIRNKQLWVTVHEWYDKARKFSL